MASSYRASRVAAIARMRGASSQRAAAFACRASALGNGQMTPRRIEVFVAVMKAGTISRAAEGLGVTQPGVSRTLTEFERAFGSAPFDRTRGRSVPTPEGTPFHREVLAAYRGMDLPRASAARIRDQGAGPLRVASLVPRAFRRFRQRQPTAWSASHATPASASAWTRRSPSLPTVASAVKGVAQASERPKSTLAAATRAIRTPTPAAGGRWCARARDRPYSVLLPLRRDVRLGALPCQAPGQRSQASIPGAPPSGCSTTWVRGGSAPYPGSVVPDVPRGGCRLRGSPKVASGASGLDRQSGCAAE